MKASLEIKDTPSILRSLRLWIQSYEKNSSIKIGFVNSDKKTINLSDTEHSEVILHQISYDQTCVEIQVLQGKIKVTNLEINYSWKVNSYFYDNHSAEIEKFINSEFNINEVSNDFFQDLLKYDLFQSTGSSDYSATTDLSYNVRLNQHLLKNNKIDCAVNTGDWLSFDVHMTSPAILPQMMPNVNNFDFEWKQNVNQKIINNIDLRFYEFVEKKLTNKNIKWQNQLFSRYKMPYAYKVRIQAQLIENIEFIKDKHVVDLGCDRGQFLFPCLTLGCASVTGIQPLSDYNHVINEALDQLNLRNRANAIHGNVYDLNNLKNQLRNKDTVLALGLLYHLNNHYQFLEAITQTDVTALVIDISILTKEMLDFYCDKNPKISYHFEKQGIDINGWELADEKKLNTFVGIPNASRVIECLTHMGWTVKSNVLQSMVNLPRLRYRGVVTFHRELKL